MSDFQRHLKFDLVLLPDLTEHIPIVIGLSFSMYIEIIPQ